MNIKPKKSLSQNFIIDESYLSKITSAAKIQKNDLVLEIGPGFGNLSRWILNTGAKVLAVEKDDNLCLKMRALAETYKGRSSIKIVKADIMKISLSRLVKDYTSNELNKHFDLKGRNQVLPSGWPHRIILFANLPFNITSDFLEKVLVMDHHISELYLMVQDEVGFKLALSDPGKNLYRSITMTTRFFSSISYLFKIPRFAYYPSPNIDGCLLKFNLRSPEDCPVIRGIPFDFCDFVKLCSASSRKMLKNNCASIYGEITVSLMIIETGHREKIRISNMTVNDSVILFNLLSRNCNCSIEKIITNNGFFF